MTPSLPERPILFSGPMVCAILDGRKTQTRRVVKWKPRVEGLNLQATSLSVQPYFRPGIESGVVLASRDGNGSWNDRTHPVKCPYGKPGDRLWVREGFIDAEDYPCHPYHDEEDGGPRYEYRADTSAEQSANILWKPSIHMPRIASRITLKVTGVRVERLQDISEEDIEAEGVLACDEWQDYLATWESMQSDEIWIETPRQYWEKRWDRINGKKYPWASNPWVWVVEFPQYEKKN